MHPNALLPGAKNAVAPPIADPLIRNYSLAALPENQLKGESPRSVPVDQRLDGFGYRLHCRPRSNHPT